MPRLEVPISPRGPILDVRLCAATEDVDAIAAAGRLVSPASSVSGLVDTGAEMTAIEQSIIDWMGIPVINFLEATSSVLGDEVRMVGVYRLRMTFGSLETSDAPRWRTIYAIGVKVVSPGAVVLVGRDLLATCRFTYDGRKRRLMMSY